MQVSFDSGGVTQRRLERDDWRQWRRGCDVTRTCRSTFCRLTATQFRCN